MISTIKPIETKYKGYRFRSRLEARWAVFFDTLGCKWEYEPEGYDLGLEGWYLPDFKLSGEAWVEIKPNSPQTKEVIQSITNKCKSLCIMLGEPVLLIQGNPWPEEYWTTYFLKISLEEKTELKNVPLKKYRIEDDCLIVESFIFSLGGRLSDDPRYDKELMNAFNAARSARFENR